MTDWHTCQLSGDAHFIPRCCPNCTSEGIVEVRTTSANVVQSFYYCDRCAVTAQAENRYNEGRRSGCLSYIIVSLGMFVSIPFVAITFTILNKPNEPQAAPVGAVAPLTASTQKANVERAATGSMPDDRQSDPPPTTTGSNLHLEIWCPMLVLVAGFFFSLLVASWLQKLPVRRLMWKYPRQPDQAVWGIAAFCNGNGKYEAANREWINLLAEANRAAISNAELQRLTGQSKFPDKPFGNT